MAEALPHVFYDTSSRRYLAGSEIAAGGEGSIHEVRGEPDRLLKLYDLRSARPTSERRQQLQELRQKVKYMIAHPPAAAEELPQPADHHYWTWPLVRVFSRDGIFSGYVMPRLTGIKGEEFLQLGSGHSWQARLIAARNLARLLRATHGAGYIVGDLNPRNLFFTAGADPTRSEAATAAPMVLPSLTDTDSFQVGGVDGEPILHPCRVQNPEYSAPELINATSDDRTVEQDYFCLAIIVFQLLALGLHPYAGTSRNSTDQEIRTNIARGRNLLFSDASELIPPKKMVDLAILPPEILALFEQTFRRGDTVTRARASAADWAAVLDRVLAEGLRICHRKPNHHYGAHLPDCPWCSYARRLGADPFNLPAARRPGRTPAPREIETDRATPDDRSRSGIATRPGNTTAPPTTQGGSDTHFGPLPTDAATNTDPQQVVAPEPTPPPPPTPEPEPVGDPQAQPPPKSGPPWFLSPTAILLGVTATLFVLAFAFRGPLREGWTGSVLPFFAGIFERDSGRSPRFDIPPVEDACGGACRLTAVVCVDRDAPFDCTGDTISFKPEHLLLFGPDSEVVRFPDATIRNTYQRLAQDLRSGSYRIDIDDSNLSAAYAPCPTNQPDINPPGGDSVGIELTADRRIVFAYCLR